METKLDSRQSQFPATFPDTFKDFFAMMSEDEDHMELFSNLLEDKVIPRTSRHNQRRCGGSLRCTSTTSTAATNFGRSNSFRVNRPVASGNSYCRHIKYCCLHQKNQQQQHQQSCLHNSHQYSYGNEVLDERQHRHYGMQQLNNSRPTTLTERSFECESCEESDSPSTTSSSATSGTLLPYSMMRAGEASGAFHSKGIPLPTQDRIAQQCGLRDAIMSGCSSQPPGGSGCIGGENHSGIGGTTTVNKGNLSIPGIGRPSTITNTSSNSNVMSCSGNTNNNNTTSISNNNNLGAGCGTTGGGGLVPSGTTSVSMGPSGALFDINATSSMSSTPVSMTKCFSDKLNCCSRATTMRSQKSPILNRRRSSSIAANLLTSDNKVFRNAEDPPPWTHMIPHSSTRERLCHIKSPVNSTAVHTLFKGKTSASNMSTGISDSGGGTTGGGVPSFKQTLSNLGGGGSSVAPHFPSLPAILGGISTPSAATSTAVTPTSTGRMIEGFFSGSTATISQQPAGKQKQRMRTSSMPAESRKPRLADTRRAAIHCADVDLEYYRLRSFSITSHGICNLGDSMRSRRSRSINSVTSTGTSNSGRDRNNSNASRTSGDIVMEMGEGDGGDGSGASIPAYKIAILGASGVGKTALTYQFTTSDYICAYDLSLDDDYGQKTVSVLLDGMETDLEIIDHPACEMSTEAFCSTYNIDLFVVVYSVVDRNSFKVSERILHYLKDNEMLLTRGAILVGNKTDLERHREVPRQTGRRLAKEIFCKFIETSSGLDHNVNELLVGIVAQVKLNKQRIHNLTERDRQRLSLSSTLQKHRRIENPMRKIVKQRDGSPGKNSNSKSGPIKKISKRTLNLESILKVGESEVDDDDEDNDDSGSGVGKPRSRSGGGGKSDGEREIRRRDRRYKRKPDLIGLGGSTGDLVGSNSGASSISPKKFNNSYDNQNLYQNQTEQNLTLTNLTGDISNSSSSSSCSNSREKTVSKLSNRTKIFLTSILKFKKNLNVKRRNSSSCSDLFVI